MIAVYTPPTGSLAARVCSFFRANPDEALSVADIVAKFDAPPNDIPDLLLGAVVQRQLKVTGGKKYATYSAGSALHQAAPAAAVPQPRPAPKKSNRLPALDLDRLTVEHDVPLPAKYAPNGLTRYDPIFERMTAVGMSMALPVQYQAAIEKARLRYAKQVPDAKYRVRKVDAEQCRVFRVA